MFAYQQGRFALLTKLGLDAEAFAQMATKDDTDELSDQNADESVGIKGVDKPPAWGGQSSLEAGDAGTRNHQMGLSRGGGV